MTEKKTRGRKPAPKKAESPVKNDMQRQITAMEAEIKVASRLLAIKRAKNDLLSFVGLTMPDPEDPDDADRSIFKPGPHHRLIAKKLEDLADGKIKRLVIVMPPRHGKSELGTRRFPSWFIGRNPNAQVIVTGYSADFAETEFGKPIREVMQSPAFRQVFPDCELATGSASSKYLRTTRQGSITTVGAGGSIVGRGAHLFVIDDPTRSLEEAESQAQSDNLWDWYRTVARTRLLPGGRMLIIMQRWNEHDLVGRILAESGHEWDVLHLPAIAGDNDALGRSPGEALWPEWYPLSDLLSLKRDLGARHFEGLYQGNPIPEEGLLFKRSWVDAAEVPQNAFPERERLRVYGALDIAVTSSSQNDATAFPLGGMDQDGTLWIFDMLHARLDAENLVDAIIDKIEEHDPLIVYSEKGLIAKSIGAWLNKRMEERRVWTSMEEHAATRDKATRAQTFRSMLAAGRVKFPRDALWWPAVKAELMKFGSGSGHDDAVDALAWLALGVRRMHHASPVEVREEHAPLTAGWFRAMIRKDERTRAIKKAVAGW